jgi:hypothetical protein
VRRRHLVLPLVLLVCLLAVPMVLTEAQGHVLGARYPLCTPTPGPYTPEVWRSRETLVAQGSEPRAWQRTGPEGGYVRDMCAAGDRLYALVGLNDSEVFAYDGGSWRSTGMRPWQYACGPDGAIYVSSCCSLYRSLDGGTTQGFPVFSV